MLTFYAQPSAIAQVHQGILRPTVRTTWTLPMHPSIDSPREHPKAVACQGPTRCLVIWAVINQSTGGRSVLSGRDHGEVLKCSLVLSICVIFQCFVVNTVTTATWRKDWKQIGHTTHSHRCGGCRRRWLPRGPWETQKPGSALLHTINGLPLCLTNFSACLTWGSSSIFKLLIFILREGWRCGRAVEIYTEMSGSKWSAGEGEMKAMELRKCSLAGESGNLRASQFYGPGPLPLCLRFVRQQVWPAASPAAMSACHDGC